MITKTFAGYRAMPLSQRPTAAITHQIPRARVHCRPGTVGTAWGKGQNGANVARAEEQSLSWAVWAGNPA